jgi:CubicO group peptidase (beta-lactamase class C family)
MDTVVPESVGVSSARLQRIDSLIQRYIEQQQLPGAIVVLLRHSQVVHFACYGHMDAARTAPQPMRADTLFRIFSMTKPITCAAVLLLYEEGYLRLSDPVSLFIPGFKDVQVLVRQTEAGLELAPLQRPITIYDLLTHTAGLGYGLDALTPVDTLFQQARMMHMDETLAEKVQRIVQMPLHHQPGLRYVYSISTDVLGHVVELISGMPLDAFFKQRIFAPLGMMDTDFYVPGEKQSRLAVLYTLVPHVGLVNMAMLDASKVTHFLTGAWIDKIEKPLFLSGGGGLVSTAADYLRFAMLLRKGGEVDGLRLLSRKTVELMTMNHLQKEQFKFPGVGYGFGLEVITDMALAQGLDSVGAYYGSGVANTQFWVDRQEDLVGLLMMQVATPTPHPLRADIRTLALQAIVD